jgi:fimbrial chaperone protein
MQRRLLGRLGALATGTLLAIASAPTPAGNFTASPVQLRMPAAGSATSLTLENKGDEPVLIQASTMRWSQQDGEDLLEPTEDVVVSPPIFTVPPGGVQTVRIGLLRGADPARELTYRVFLQEVPPPPRPDRPGVAVALRLGLPLFVPPAGRTATKVDWDARTTEDGTIELSLSNVGTGHVQVLDARLALEDGTVMAEVTPRAYVLAGQARSWRVKPLAPWDGRPLRVVARTSGGELASPLERVR